MKFIHTHVHTEYSTLDGMCKLTELIETAHTHGQSAIAITDHGTMSALFAAQELGKEGNIKIIHGCEYYYQRETDDNNGHLIVFAKNNKGLENMFKMQEHSYVYNFYKKPRINWDLLQENAEGLIVTTACLASTFNQYLINGDLSLAKQWAQKYKSLFGKDFYIEIQPNSIPEQYTVNKSAIKIAEQLDIKLIAANDVHYIKESDVFPHEVLLAMQINKKMSDESRWKFPTQDFWYKTYDEMVESFGDLPISIIEEALENTLIIENECNAEIIKGKYLPDYYDIPKGKTQRELLIEKVTKGLETKQLFGSKSEYIADVQREINTIDDSGYSGYFLIVQDYINTARKNNIIVGDGRGSCAGSKVSYLLDITRIEPKKFGLLFERFMTPGRSPDIDTDFSDQEAVFDDLIKKYGHNSVARIIAFGKMTPRAVVRKVLSTFEHNQAFISKTTKLISETCKTMKQAYEESKELLAVKEKYPLEFSVIDRLEGVISHESQHAGGVIIYPDIGKHLPIKTRGEDRTKRIVGFDKYMLEDLGFYKLDILGLETLPVIKNTLESIEKHTGELIDLYKINYDDKEVYKMLSQGDVLGVFQIAEQAQRVMEQQPQNFLDLIAINALIRPGTGDWQEYIARRKGKAKKINILRAPYLAETEGLITYQEQFLLDCKTFPNWDLAFADKNVRKNKDIENDTELKELFISDSIKNEHNEEEAKQVWCEIVDAVKGGYSFNKSHSASYAMLSYQTAWLKYYYPAHFYAALMSSKKTDSDGQVEVARCIAECKKRGIQILPPDINRSGDKFEVNDENSINYKMTSIKHVGESAIESIINMRPIKNFEDFMLRKEKSQIRKNVLHNLILAGCFDFDNKDRAHLLWLVDMDNRTKTEVKNEVECPRIEWGDEIQSENEKNVLGMYLTRHPMERYGFKPLQSYAERERALAGGVIKSKRVFFDKNGREMCFAQCDTIYGIIKIIIFSSSWSEEVKNLFEDGEVLLIRGFRSGGDLIFESAEKLEEEDDE